VANHCSDPECDNTRISARGLCSKHYQRYRYQGRLDEVAPEPDYKTCGQCGANFNPKLRRWGAVYCSKRCNDNARYDRNRRAKYPEPVKACEHCGASFDKKRVDARFCSDKCGQDWRNAQTAARTLASKADRAPCHGCGGPMDPHKAKNALYCSEQCKIRSRRHEAYGLTKQELDVLLEQHEQCAICGATEWGGKGPQVDHCHRSGRVRGVLCNNCNNGLGRFRDAPARLRAAAEYLERFHSSV
jgi:Recombination endonuclease VII